jgi:UDP-N-acetylbacillosamine N-acetyltransferase
MHETPATEHRSTPASLSVVVWGASGHALVVADILRLRGHRVAGYLDNINPKRRGEAFGGAEVLGGPECLGTLRAEGLEYMVIAVGDCTARLRLGAESHRRGWILLTVIHPSATVADSAELGAGCVLAAGSVINPEARIGANGIVNTCASVDHECILGDGVHVGPGAHLAARVTVGTATFIGVGCAIRDRVRIGSQCVIGAGSTVVRDVPDGVVAYGSPVRVVRRA